MSDKNDLKSAVPLCSAIGLFIIYINDLPDNLTNTVKMYADDTNFLPRIRKNSIDEDTKKLQEDIDKIMQGTNIWLIRLSLSKCEVMHI